MTPSIFSSLTPTSPITQMMLQQYMQQQNQQGAGPAQGGTGIPNAPAFGPPVQARPAQAMGGIPIGGGGAGAQPGGGSGSGMFDKLMNNPQLLQSILASLKGGGGLPGGAIGGQNSATAPLNGMSGTSLAGLFGGAGGASSTPYLDWASGAGSADMLSPF